MKLAKDADQLIEDLLDSGIFDATTWYTDHEEYDVRERTVWYLFRNGSVSSSTYDLSGDEIGWSPICSGSKFDRLYLSEGQIRHTGRSHKIAPPDIIVICG